MAKGLCSYCYSKQYQARPENRERVKKQKHASYQRLGGKTAAKKAREERWFAGLREAALERDGHACVQCGSTKSLIVHHKDGNGRGSDNPNNTLDNFETLCRSHHASLHHTIDRWSRKYDCCRHCGTTERKHNARGLCWGCYQKWLYHGRPDDMV